MVLREPMLEATAYDERAKNRSMNEPDEPQPCFVSIPFLKFSEETLSSRFPVKQNPLLQKIKHPDIGPAFQATNIPEVLKSPEDKTSSDCGALLWDPTEGQQLKGPVEELQKTSRNRIEDSWSIQEKILFELYTRELGKDLAKVQKKIRTKTMSQVVEYFYWEKVAFLRKDPEIFKLRTSMADLLAPCLDKEIRFQLEDDKILLTSRKRIRDLSPEPQPLSASTKASEIECESESEDAHNEEPDSNVHIDSETDLHGIKDETSCDESYSPAHKKQEAHDPHYDNVSVYIEKLDPLVFSSEEAEQFVAQHKRIKRDTALGCFDSDYTFDFSSQLHTSSSNLFSPEEEQKEDDDPFFGSVFSGELL